MSVQTSAGIDFDRFRLRKLLERLIDLGEVEIHDEPVALGDLSRIIEATPQAVLFRRAGPEAYEMLASVSGSRRRLAAALGVTEDKIHETLIQRMAAQGSTIEVSSSDAPVHAVVKQGQDVDLTKLPFHFQHELDGGLYISSALDITVDPDTGRTNVGARRLSLRNRTECGTNLTNVSHLKEIYKRCVAKGQRLPIAFVVGSHPADAMAALERTEGNELAALGAFRGAPVPVVKCVTCDLRVPADAEMVLEGYLDEKGWREPEGPFGEYLGYYGEMHPDPVFHCLAITMRRDALYQTALHGSMGALDTSESSQNSACLMEARIINFLRSNRIAEPVAVHVVKPAGIATHVRVAIRQQRPGQARQVLTAILAIWRVKHVWVFDEDIDVTKDAQCEWAMSTRFQGDRDLVLLESAVPWPIDPSLGGKPLGAKLGFDCTVPFGRPKKVIYQAAKAPVIPRRQPRFESVRSALKDGPKYFGELMAGLGSLDGREITLALDEIRNEGSLGRDQNGRYLLHPSKKGETALIE